MTLHSITATYPGFQSLPKGVKQMLLISESTFFDEARALKTNQTGQQGNLHNEVIHVPPQAGSGFGPRATLRAS